MVWVFRICVVIVGALGTILALTVQNVYGLLVLCGDLMAVSQFPQLVCALWVKASNTYGSLAGLVVGLLMRVLGGDPVLGMKAVIKYPFYDPKHNQQTFPFKILATVCSILVIIAISYITNFVFTRNYLSHKFDIFNCFPKEKTEKCDEHENSAMLQLNNEDLRNEKSDKKLDDSQQ